MASGTTLGTAYVQIQPSTKGIKGAISSVIGGEASSAGASAGASIAGKLKGAILAAGIGTAIIGTLKAAIDEGAKLQQSYMGGLDTIYGDAAGAAREYAQAAAAAGISMNDYSEQAISFGAALKQAYSGDTVKAAEAANTAIMDMADNSAKMGTDIESVQAAYQGFAKQNYTMLDNLKLGYGGTKTEMERLLADAEKLSGIHYDINNLGDVYDAIHVIQGELGLTGVAADEAADTLSGSFNAMKAAGQNFLGSLALGEDVGPALSTLADTVSTFFFDNLLPMVGTILDGLPDLILTLVTEGLPKLVTGFVNLLTNFATSLTETADSLGEEGVTNWGGGMIPKLLSTAGELVGQLAMGLITNIPKIVLAVGRIGLEIITGLGAKIWGKITEAAQGIHDRFMEKVELIKSTIREKVEAIKDRFLKPIQDLRDKVSEIIEKIKGFFNFNVKTPNIPFPHFSISPEGWKLGDLLHGSIPHLSISWAAKGGIVDGANLIGAGEAGPEAIVPLKPFWDRLETALTGNSQPVVINVYASDGMDVEQVAAAVERRLIKSTNNRRLAWA